MFGFGKKKTLEEHIKETKKIIVQDIIFHIKKIDVVDYLQGAKVMYTLFQTYKMKGNSEDNDELKLKQMKKARDYMRDVIMAGVVKPKLKRKDEDEGIHIDEVLNDWLLAKELSEAIISYTLGKKK